MPQVSIRTSSRRLTVIDRAAAIRGVSRTEFMLQSSEAAAIEILNNRPVIAVDDGVWDEFVAALDAPIELDPALKARHSRKPQWHCWDRRDQLAGAAIDRARWRGCHRPKSARWRSEAPTRLAWGWISRCAFDRFCGAAEAGRSLPPAGGWDLVVVPPVSVMAVVLSVTEREAAVAVAVQAGDDPGQRPVVLGARDDRVAVRVQHLEDAHGERARGLVPEAGKLLEFEVAVAIGVVRGVAVVADLIDLGLRERPVTVRVDGIEHFERRGGEAPLVEEAQSWTMAAVKTAAVIGMADPDDGGPAKDCGEPDDDQGSGSRLHRCSPVSVIEGCRQCGGRMSQEFVAAHRGLSRCVAGEQIWHTLLQVSCGGRRVGA